MHDRFFAFFECVYEGYPSVARAHVFFICKHVVVLIMFIVLNFTRVVRDVCDAGSSVIVLATIVPFFRHEIKCSPKLGANTIVVVGVGKASTPA